MTSALAAVPVVAAQLVTGAALVSAAIALAATRRPAPALGVLLDLLVAAGLLRLVGDPGWTALASAAVIIALRHLVGSGLRQAAASWRAGPPSTGRRPGLRRSFDVATRRALHPAWRL